MSQTASTPKRETPPPPTTPRPFEFPKHATKKLANGLTVFVIEDHRLPLVSYSLELLAGAAYVPPPKSGLASFTAGLLREGTTKRSSQDLARLVDEAGGSLGASADEDTASVNGTFMKSFADLGMELMSDIVRNPKFDQSEVDRQLQQAISGLAVNYSDPAYVKGVVGPRALLGTHPYGYPNSGTAASLRSLKREDFMEFHKTYYVPSNAWLAIAGDVTPEEGFARAEKYFGDWKAASPKLPAVPKAPASKRSVVVLDMPKAVQTQISVMHPGVQRNDPDFLALNVANQIFGGSFNSRLNMKLRANEGLTYGANSGLAPYRSAGAWSVGTFTRTERTADAIRMILDLAQEWRKNPATPAEFQEARQFLVGSFGLSVETAGDVAGRVLASAIYGLPDEYWMTYRDKLNALTLEQVTTAVQKHMSPDNLVIVAVGNASEFSKSLEPFGAVTVIPESEFDPLADNMRKAGEKVLSGPSGSAQAQQLVAGAVTAMGGAEKLKAINTLTSTGKLKLSTPQGEMDADTLEQVVYPDKYKLVMKLPIGEVTQAYDGKGGWMGQGAMKRDLPPEVGPELAKGIPTASGIGLLLAATNNTAEIQALAPQEVEGKIYPAVLWKRDGFDVKMLFDPETKTLARITYKGLGMAGPAETEVVFADYRDVNGVKLPFKETIYQNGSKVADRTITERVTNKAIDAAEFEKK